MGLFEETEAGIFKDESCLMPDYLPERLPCREKEIEAIASCLKPLAYGKRGRNLFMYGPTGVGKTAAVRYVLRELEDYTSKARGLYINCFQTNSRYALLTEITNFLGFPLPKRGLSSEEVYSAMREAMPKCRFSPIIVLDEFDVAVAKGSGSEILYDLLRAAEQGIGFFTLILISNDETLAAMLDDRVRSSLMPESVSYEPYSPAQLKAILQERINLSFQKGKVDSDVVGVAAAHASKLGGDARIAIESLLVAGRMAERDGSNLTVQHLRSAFSSVDSASVLKAVQYLNADERRFLRIIAENNNTTSGRLYSIIDSQFGMPERTKRMVLERLKRFNIIEFEHISLGNRGKTRRIRLRASPDAVIERLSADG